MLQRIAWLYWVGGFLVACDSPGGGNGNANPSAEVTSATPDARTDTGADTAAPDTQPTDASPGDSAPPADSTPPGDTGPDTQVPPDTTPSANAPKILLLQTNVQTLHEGETLVVTAVVTDPDGIDDLIGGTLLDVDSGNSYGAFASSAAEGSYELDLAWGAIQTVRDIDAPTTGVGRTFVARFFDVAGHTAEQTVAITLRCKDAIHTACDGVCVDLQQDAEHCGTCDIAAPPGAYCDAGTLTCGAEERDVCPALPGGHAAGCFDLRGSLDACGSCDHACPAWSSAEDLRCDHGTCRATDSTTSKKSCTQWCDEHGYTCVSAKWFYETPSRVTVNATCSEAPPVAHPDYPGSTYADETCECANSAGGPATCDLGDENTITTCSDGCSNDGDTYIDCDDFNCCSVVECAAGTACNP